jgi:hypothetical protein
MKWVVFILTASAAALEGGSTSGSSKISNIYGQEAGHRGCEAPGDAKPAFRIYG